MEIECFLNYYLTIDDGMKIFYKEIIETENLNQLFFAVIIIILAFLILFLRLSEPKRYLLNLFRPNVYLFEYEPHIKHPFSFYSILNFIVNFLSLYTFSLAFLSFNTIFDKILVIKLAEIIFFINIYKLFTDYFLLILYKKKKYFDPLRFIRNVYENHLFFYLFIFSFLIFYFPIKNNIFLIISLLIFTIYFIYYFLSLYTSISKHLNLSGYQIILYLCTSKIIPILYLVYWISLHIL